MITFKEIDEIAGRKVTEYEIEKVEDNKVYIKNTYLHGVIDLYGNVIIPPIYKNVSLFYDNLCICEDFNSIYIYDCKKNIFNKIRYKEIKEISYIGNGYFKSNLQDSDIIYIIDKSGQIVKKNFNQISRSYSKLSKFHNSFAIFKISNQKNFFKNTSLYGLINDKGIEVLKAKYLSLSIINDKEIMAVTKSKKVIIIDYNGKKLRKLNLSFVALDDFENGLAIFYDFITSGVINEKGDIVIKPNYYGIKRKCDVFLVQALNLSYGIIDFKGHVLLDFIYDSITVVDNDTFIASKNNKYYIIKSTGNVIYASDSVIQYKDSVFYDADKVINYNGNIVFRHNNAKIKHIYNFFIVNEKNKYSLLDKNGNVLIKNKDNPIFVIDNNFIIVDNNLVNINQEYLKINYRLELIYDDHTVVKYFESNELRKEYEKKLRVELLNESYGILSIKSDFHDDIDTLNSTICRCLKKILRK